MKKLSELHPEHCAVAAFPGRFQLTFDCMTTPGGRVSIYFHRGPPQPGVWQCTSAFRVFPGLEHLGEQPDISCLSLMPSIGDHVCWKRNHRCQGHVTIINGIVCP